MTLALLLAVVGLLAWGWSRRVGPVPNRVSDRWLQEHIYTDGKEP